MIKEIVAQEIPKLFGALAMRGVNLSNVAIAGGYIRDCVLRPDVQPKDVDVVLVQTSYVNFGEGFSTILPDGWSVLAEYDSNYDGGCKSVDFDKRIDHVTKLRYERKVMGMDFNLETIEFNVDLIYALSNYETTSDFVRDFDFNMNQWEVPGYLVWSASAGVCLPWPERYLGQNFGELVQTRGTEVHEDRIVRMRHMAASIGWATPTK